MSSPQSCHIGLTDDDDDNDVVVSPGVIAPDLRASETQCHHMVNTHLTVIAAD